MKHWLRNLIPNWALSIYHGLFATLAGLYFLFPSKKLFVIGVTGTNGKSTVVQMIGHILRQSKLRVAWMSTATESVGEGITLNSRKMTMPGHGTLQRFLRKAVKAECTHAVIEVSSQGIAQSRHLGIVFDVAVFTNLTPEHIESHGSFGQYRDAKLSLFRYVSSRRATKWGKLQERIGVINLDDPEGTNFMSVHIERYYGTSFEKKSFPGVTKMFTAEDIHATKDGYRAFRVDGIPITLPLLGNFNVHNALSAIAACAAVGIPVEQSIAVLETFEGVPGRLEFILREPFSVIVDYAPEPASMQALYAVAEEISHNRIIHVFGSAGGGRDKARRPVMGSIVGSRADIAIVTNEDPYDEDPLVIMNHVAQGVISVGRKHKGEDLFVIPERRRAIEMAIEFAREGDIILITGKACEQWIMGPKGTKTPWDDRVVCRELLSEKGFLSTDPVDR